VIFPAAAHGLVGRVKEVWRVWDVGLEVEGLGAGLIVMTARLGVEQQILLVFDVLQEVQLGPPVSHQFQLSVGVC